MERGKEEVERGMWKEEKRRWREGCGVVKARKKGRSDKEIKWC